LGLLAHEAKPRLELNAKWIENIYGVRSVSFRCPRLFDSTMVCNALEELGYVSDASYSMCWHRNPLEPYHPDRSDWTKPGDLKLMEIANFANLARPSADAHGRDLDQCPKVRTKSSADLLDHIDEFLAYLDSNHVARKALAFYFYPWEFRTMPEGLSHFGKGAVLSDPFIVKKCGDFALEQLDQLISGLKTRGGEFLSVARIAERSE